MVAQVSNTIDATTRHIWVGSKSGTGNYFCCNWMKHDFYLVNIKLLVCYYELKFVDYVNTSDDQNRCHVYINLIYIGNSSKYMTIVSKVWWMFPFHRQLDLAATELLPTLTFKTSPMTYIYSNIKRINPTSLHLKQVSNWSVTHMGVHRNFM
jgi:hypothetical protein